MSEVSGHFSPKSMRHFRHIFSICLHPPRR